ncbi:MAG: DUF115 domain-containing protein [Rhodospirillales bacterium]|nr:DUF115 domain-containing protein [Rhodospirillales bacterium]MCW9039923.1 DUF115 domain-containing protein [Rhodospirillales bacterium]
MEKSEATALRKRSRNTLKERFPKEWALCEKSSEENLVFVGGAAVNINLGTMNLYPYGAPEWSSKQVDHFHQAQDRLVFSNLYHCNLSKVSIELLDEMVKQVNAGKDSLSLAPVVDYGYTFVFGVGLGYHIPRLVDELECHNLVLIEPVPDFLALSASAIDWQAILEKADSKKIKIHLVLGKEPLEIVRLVENVLYREGSTFLDGSYFYQHYYSWALHNAFVLFKERIKHHYISTGFFEDELDMMNNAFGNFKEHTFRLLSSKKMLAQNKMPAFVVASGPSIDKDLEYIRKWQDKAVIISAGTGLRVLLANGIKPDIHVEIENIVELYRVFDAYKEQFDLSGIVLAGAMTLRPKIGYYFDKRWFFHRMSLSSSIILGEGTEPLVGSSPMVSNAGCAVAVGLGFQNVYLFGVDCGRREDGTHHSKDSLYFQESFEDMEKETSDNFDQDRIIPGNFGGKVISNWAFDLSRKVIEQLQLRTKVALFNCSDGAQIEGAKPKTAASINLSDVSTSKESILSILERQLPEFDRYDYMARTDFSPHIEGCNYFIDGIRTLMDELSKEKTSFREKEDRLSAWLKENEDKFGKVYSMTRGSVRSMLRVGAFLGTRIVNEDERRKFLEYFAVAYTKKCIGITEEARTLLERFDAERKKIAEDEKP